ncbi:CcdB family protein [Alphaproteobacteria bacterium]|jgi:toxin CcdB|nr:CcdB family protein [Alphaproteobacteria bacterium]
MAKFDVYANPSGFGYLVDLQADVFEAMRSRVVAPLMPIDTFEVVSERLNPKFVIDGEEFVLLTQAAAAVDVMILKQPISSLSDQFWEITNALDMLFQGF